MPRRKERGFSLIELMMVIAIIGVLSAIALPYFAAVQSKSKRTELTLNMAGIFTAEVAYYTTANDWIQTCTPAASCQCPNKAFDFGLQGFDMGSAKFYQFCLSNANYPITFEAWAYGNIDRDPTIDTGMVDATRREVSIMTDDLLN